VRIEGSSEDVSAETFYVVVGRATNRLPGPMSPRNASVVQHSLRWIVEVVELPVTRRLDEQGGEYAAQDQGDRQEKENGVHVGASFMLASIRDEPQITMALDAGIRMAATRGLINPAAAALTATML